jgi:hypothetical protein
MQRSWCSVVLICLIAFGSVARGDEVRVVPPAAVTHDAPADLMARGVRMKRWGTALIVVAALLDGAITGLAIGGGALCRHRPIDCGIPQDIAIASAMHTVALGVGIPLYVVGKSKLARGRREALGMALAPVGDTPGASGGALQLRLRF